MFESMISGALARLGEAAEQLSWWAFSKRNEMVTRRVYRRCA